MKKKDNNSIKRKRRPGVSINGPGDIVRLLNKQINLILKDESEDKEQQSYLLNRLRALTYSSLAILKALDVGEMEERLNKLEKQMDNS